MQEENEVNADEIHSRNLRSELCVINRSDGSVKFSQGGTSGEPIECIAAADVLLVIRTSDLCSIWTC